MVNSSWWDELASECTGDWKIEGLGCFRINCLTTLPTSKWWTIECCSSGPWCSPIVSPYPSILRSWSMILHCYFESRVLVSGVDMLFEGWWGPDTEDTDGPGFDMVVAFCGHVFLLSLYDVDYSFSALEIRSPKNVFLPKSALFFSFLRPVFPVVSRVQGVCRFFFFPIGTHGSYVYQFIL